MNQERLETLQEQVRFPLIGTKAPEFEAVTTK